MCYVLDGLCRELGRLWGKTWTKSGAREGLWERNVKFPIWGYEEFRPAESHRSFQIVKKLAKASKVCSTLPHESRGKETWMGQGTQEQTEKWMFPLPPAYSLCPLTYSAKSLFLLVSFPWICSLAKHLLSICLVWDKLFTCVSFLDC